MGRQPLATVLHTGKSDTKAFSVDLIIKDIGWAYLKGLLIRVALADKEFFLHHGIDVDFAIVHEACTHRTTNWYTGEQCSEVLPGD